MGLNLVNSLSSQFSNIDWNYISNELTQYLKFDDNRNDFLRPILATNINAIETKLNQTQVFFQLFVDHHQQQMEKALSIGPTSFPNLESLKKKGHQGISELNNYALLIELFLQVKTAIKNDIYLFYGDKNGMEIIREIQSTFVKDFRRIVTPEGEIVFDNHPELKKIKLEISSTEFLIKEKIDNYFSDSSLKDKWQFESHDLIYDHYVVPVRSDSYNASLGTIISKSTSGQTLYIEPNEIKGLNSKRLVSIAKFQELIYKICQDFTNLLSNHAETIENIFFSLKEIDQSFARAKFSYYHNLVRPTVSESHSLQIFGLFHPLIKNCVPNDAVLSKENFCLVISGPNTGGKSVYLKSIILTQLFMQMGIYSPAKEAILPIFKTIFFLSGEGQDIAQGLSSFSAECSHFLDVISSFEESNLIFIDEIFNTTCSEEASCLAFSFFEEIKKFKNTYIVATTHHGLLKMLTYNCPGYAVAHMVLEEPTSRPTYKVKLGTPGSSSALKIFEKLVHKNEELKEVISTRAIELSNEKSKNIDSIIVSLSNKQEELLLAIETQNKINEENDRNNRRMIDDLKKSHQNAITDFKEKLDRLYNETKSKFTEVKEIKRIEKIRNQALDNLSGNINRPFEEEFLKSEINEKSSLKAEDVLDFVIGEKYYNKSLRKNVILREINFKKNVAKISFSNITLNCQLDELGTKKEESSRKEIHYQIFTEVRTEIDCRGMNLEEFSEYIERNIVHLLTGEIPYLSVIHGIGDGILKKWLVKFLDKNSNKYTYEVPSSYNGGVTRIYSR